MSKSEPRGIWIAGNWKMNHGPKDTLAFVAELGTAIRNQSELQKALKGELHASIFPPVVSIPSALTGAQNLSLKVGAQTVNGEKSGAFTGEISAPMLIELGVKLALVGHSERRQHFGETDESARKRAEGLLAQGFEVIYCIGETRAEREDGKTKTVLDRQLQAALSAGVVPYCDGRLLFAYEPVWAIGTGLTATPEQAEEAHYFIRSRLKEKSARIAAATPLLYGGSVTPQNVDSLLACPNVNGCLVGGASLKAESFLKLLQAGQKALLS